MNLVALLLIAVGLAQVNGAIVQSAKTHAEPSLPHQGLYSFYEQPNKLLYVDGYDSLQVSDDSGRDWTSAIEGAKVEWVTTHPHDGRVGYVYSQLGELYTTQDSGASFEKISDIPANIQSVQLSVNDPNYLMVSSGKDASSSFSNYYATTNSVDSSLKLVMENARDCQWLNNLFDNSLESSSIMCIKDGQLVITNDLGKVIENVQMDGKSLENVISFVQQSNFILAVRLGSDNDYELVVTSDGSSWSNALLPEDVKLTGCSTLLPSTKYSAHLYIPGAENVESSLFLTSDANGLYFSKRLEGVDTVVRVDNKFFDDILLASFSAGPSKISYDDGRTWNNIVADCVSGTCREDLYLLLSGLVVSPAPGIIACLGSVDGPPTESKSHLYLSDDSGLSWHMIRSEPQHFAFINSGYTLVAAPKNKKVDEIHFAHNFFGTWTSIPLENPIEISSIQQVDAVGVIIEGKDSNEEFSTIQLNFSGEYEYSCTEGDFHNWGTKFDESHKVVCLMGAKGWFSRPSATTVCRVLDAAPFHTVNYEPCDCVVADYECSETSKYDFESGECVPLMSLKKMTEECTKNPSFEYPSVYSLIPGNKCSVRNGVDMAATSSCDATFTIQEDQDNNDSKVKATLKKFDGDIIDYFYPRTTDENPDDEVIIVRTKYEQIYITHDQGGNWEQILEDVDIIGVYPNPYFPDVLYFLTAFDQIYYTTDRARTFKDFSAPLSIPEFSVAPLSFSKEDSGKVIFVGEYGCDNPFSSECSLNAYYSTDHGKNWDILERNVRRCTWVSGLIQNTDPNLILCDKILDGGERVDLISSTNFFDDKETKFENIVGYALENEFIVVAKVSEKIRVRHF
jgi:photosystem II stability/assembly factor-like uncharacterized protein